MSDHFNGKKFFNPTLEQQFSPVLSDIVSMLRAERTQWPKKVINAATPEIAERVAPHEMVVTFINHATFLLQFQNMNILTDPVWSPRVSPFSWAGPKRVREPGVAIDQLPPIDMILISHNHYDHLDRRTLKKLNKRFSPKVLAPVGDKKLLRNIGFEEVHELDWWDTLDLGSPGEIIFAPTQHSSGRGLADRDRSLWGSYYIRHGARSLYFGGDGGYSSHFTAIHEKLGAPEVAILGIGAYSPRSFMKPIHMNPAEAVLAHQDLNAGQSIGMHFGTFQLSAEAIDQPKHDLEKALKQKDLSTEHFLLLDEGQTRIFSF